MGSAPTGTEEPKLASIKTVKINNLNATMITSDFPTARAPPIFNAPSSKIATLAKRAVE